MPMSLQQYEPFDIFTSIQVNSSPSIKFLAMREVSTLIMLNLYSEELYFGDMMPVALVVLSVLFSGTLLANPEFELKRGFESYSLGYSSPRLEDKSSSLSIHDAIRAYHSNEFESGKRKSASIGFSTSSWWMVSQTYNRNDEVLDLFLSHNYPATDLFDVWIVSQNGEIIFHGKSGDQWEHQQNSMNHRLSTFPIKIPKGSFYIYTKTKSRGPLSLDISILEPEHFHEKNLLEYLIINGSAAVVFIMGLYNFCIFLQLKKKVYLYYVFFAMLFTLQALSSMGMYRVLFDNYTYLANDFYLAHSVLGLISVYLFTYYFLELYKKPILAWICRVFGFLTLITFLYVFVSFENSIKPSILASMTLSIFCLVAGIVRSTQGFRPAYFYSLAWTAILFANISRMLMLSGNLDSTVLVEFGVHFGLMFEAVLISLGLADKIRLREKADFERISNLNSDLKVESQKVNDLNESLEQQVEEQTREIKSIMRNIHLGIIVIADEELSVTGTYSEASKEIFEVRDIGRTNALDLMFSRAKLSLEQKDQIESVIVSAIGEDVICFELNEHLLPFEVEFQFEQTKILQFEWQAVADKDDLVEKVIVTIHDVTEIKSLESESKAREEELLYIGEILSTSPKKFSQFMEASVSMLGDNRRILKLNSKLNSESLKLLFINLHTIKGAARLLCLDHLTPVIHESEQRIADMMNQIKPIDRAQCIRDHAVIDTMLGFYSTLNTEKLGRTSGDSVVLTQRLIDRLYRSNQRIIDSISVEKRLEVKELNHELEGLIFVDGQELFEEVLLDAEMLARDLAKEYPKIDIEAEGVRFSLDGQKLIRKAFVHIIRNSMDHGIESAQERKEKGKSAAGTISIQLHPEESTLRMVYRDDGAGLNLPAIRKLAIERGVIGKDKSLLDQELGELIFHSGFSTSASVSDISGRGVGMSAVREYFQNHDGNVELKILPDDKTGISHENVKFELVMTIPQRFYTSKSEEYHLSA